MSAVVVNLERLEASVDALVKRMDPERDKTGMLDDLRKDSPVAAWADFSAPVGFVMDPGNGEPAMWVRVEDFAKRAKAAGATKDEGGVWTFKVGETGIAYAKPRGAYVALAADLDMLKLATKEGAAPAARIKSRAALLKGRDVFVHVNMNPLRDKVLGSIAQAAQMAPMFGMMMGSQMPGGDPQALVRMITGGIDGVQKFFEQLDYVDVLFSIGGEAANVTLLTGYKEGAIKNYLGRQQPASAKPLTHIADQPYTVAMSYHIPGEASPFLEYIVDKTVGAMLPPEDDTAQGASSVDRKALEEALRITRELYKKTEGMDAVMNMASGEMTTTGGIFGRDLKGLFVLAKEYALKAKSLGDAFGGGMTYEPLGARTIGSTEVTEYALKFDSSNPMMAKQAMMWGPDARYALGLMDTRVRFCMGSKDAVDAVFAAKITKPLGDQPLVKKSLGKLPERRNAVILINPASVARMVGQFTGGGAIPTLPPTAPIAISLSVAGEPARVDIHVPFAGIENVFKSMSGSGQM